MNKLLLAAALACASLTVAACATTVDAGTGGAAFATAGAERTEAEARARCPRNHVELALLVGLRLGFDESVGKTLSVEQRAAIDAARAQTNAACGIVAAPAPSSPAPAGDSSG